MRNNGDAVLTIPLDNSNVATFHSAGSFASYEAFTATAEIDDYDTNPMCLKCDKTTAITPSIQREE